LSPTREATSLVRQFFHCRRGGLYHISDHFCRYVVTEGENELGSTQFFIQLTTNDIPNANTHNDCIFFQCWNTRHIWLTCLNFWMVNDFNDSGQSFIPFSTMTCAPVFRNCSTNLSSVKSVTRSSFSILLHSWN
jgi:hypothetical protein